MNRRWMLLVLCAALTAHTTVAKEPAATEEKTVLETPEIKVGEQGNVEVPGLGGMKFAPNGDIFDSEGRKVYDGDTRKWAPGVLSPESKDQPGNKPAVPQVRIGDTLEQCIARLGQPKGNPPCLHFQHSGWNVGVTFYRGRIERVAYSKRIGTLEDFGQFDLFSLVTPPEPEIVALQQFYRGDIAWVKTSATSTRSMILERGKVFRLNLPRVTWVTKTRNKQLHCEFKVSEAQGNLTKWLEFSTDASKERENKTSDRTKMNRDDARLAWDLGLSLTGLEGAGPRELRKKLPAVAQFFAQMRAAQAAMVADPSLDVWRLPGTTGDSNRDRQAMANFVEQTAGKILDALGKDEVTPGEPAVAGCFELARRAPAMSLAYRAGTPQERAKHLERFAGAGRDSNLPRDLWEPVVEKANAGVSTADLDAALKKLGDDVPRFLDAKRAEWKPKKTPEK